MVKGKAILERIPGQFRGALLDQNEEVLEFHIEYDTDQSLVGGIYFGRIKAFHPALNVAFVDIGQNRDGFLEIRDVFSKGKKVFGHNIRNYLTEGQSIFVCVTRDPIAEKGPKLTMQISLSSRFLVYFPQGEGVKISQKLINNEDKQRLTQEIMTIIKTGEGVIVRSAAENATKNEIFEELIFLRDKWCRTQAQNIKRKCPVTIVSPVRIEHKLLESWVYYGIDHIALGGDLANFDATFLLQEFSDIKIHREFKICDLFEIYNLKEQLEMALSPCVELPNGARILISETPALISIDVDSGSGQSSTVSRFPLEVNLEAAKAIYQAVRLRGLSGLIVIDFLDMQNQSQYKKVLGFIKKLFSNDHLNTFVGGFTRMGAFEMTRQRLGPSLIENLTKPCSLCGDIGALGQSRAGAFDLVRSLASQIRIKINGPEAIAAPDVKRALQNSARQAFKALERQLGRKVSVETNAEQQPGSFEVLH